MGIRAGNVILLIDEVHTLVGSGSVGRGGSAGAGLDIANLLKPALARGELQVTISYMALMSTDYHEHFGFASICGVFHKI